MNNTVMLGTISLNNMAGGLERNIVYLANNLVEIGHKVILLTFDFPHATSFFEIDPRVVWIKAGVSQPHTAVTFRTRLQLIGNIRSAIKMYGVRQIVIFSHGLMARFLAAALGLCVPIICSERNALSMYSFIRQRKWNLNFLLLIFARKITVQFDEYKNDYPFWLRPKISTVHNPVFPPANQSDLSRPIILTVGRLTLQKRFDLAIKSFADTLQQYPCWQLHIIGSGPLASELQGLIDTLGVSQSVSITPPTKSMEVHYKECSVFLSTSQWEGFPNALAEALSYGILGIGFEDTKGVSSLIKDGRNGVLARGEPSVANLKEALLRIMKTQSDWPNMSKNARLISDIYSPDKWIVAWLTTLQSANNSNRKG